jgi:hypothetical protein
MEVSSYEGRDTKRTLVLVVRVTNYRTLIIASINDVAREQCCGSGSVGMFLDLLDPDPDPLEVPVRIRIHQAKLVI